jgi:hypothetical protein
MYFSLFINKITIEKVSDNVIKEAKVRIDAKKYNL